MSITSGSGRSGAAWPRAPFRSYAESARGLEVCCAREHLQRRRLVRSGRRLDHTVLSAAEDHSVHFRRIHTADGGRVRNRYWCEAEDREVTYGEVGRGYELPDGRGIPVTEEEMRALPLTTAHAVELVALRSSRPPSSTRSASRPRLLLPAGGRRGREAVRAAAPWRHRLTELVPDPNGSCPSHATALLPSSTASYTDNCSGIAACW
ncbi:Ku protein [Streptomyces shenzhenensis]|uniref:Ku protein n=1 Tax=Streptomyces shenzhenensis TaxID=943815 RepID=UPI0036BC0D81